MRFIYFILHYKRQDFTDACLESILHHNAENKDMIVIIDASHDFHILRNKEGSCVLVYRPVQKNPGFSRAMNEAWKNVKHLADPNDVLVFVNNDTVLSYRFRAQMEQLFKDPSVGAAGPKIVFWDNPARIWSAGGRISVLKMTSVGYKYFHPADDYSGTEDVDFLSGCVIAIRQDVFETIGGWPETYLFGGEEWEVSLRLRKLGYRLVIDYDTVVLHRASIEEGSGSSHTFRDLRFVVNGYLNRILFAYRNFGRGVGFLYKLYLSLYIVLGIPIRWKYLGESTSFIDKLRISFKLAKILIHRNPTQPVTWQELDKYAKNLEGRKSL